MGLLHHSELLELLERHRCHLRRGSLSMADFLEKDFDSYIQDVRQSVMIDDNLLVGSEMCNKVETRIDEIADNAAQIIKVLKLYDNGEIVKASNRVFEVFNIMKPYLMVRYSGAAQTWCYYRIRRIDERNPFPIERKELFHIPHNENYLVGTERYSMPGHPCLYLASQPELAWYESESPTTFAIAKFLIPHDEENCLKFIDFSEKLMPLKHSFICWFQSGEDKEDVEEYLLKYIYTYPLRAACSVIVEHPDGKFIEEYIIPQLLLQWVRNDKDFDGIRYESCSRSEKVRTLGGHNAVFVTKKYDTEGYDIKLRKSIKIGLPQKFDISTIEGDEKLYDSSHDFLHDPFLWRMDSISNDFQNF